MAKRILVVDDDENILNLEKTILEQKGFDVTPKDAQNQHTQVREIPRWTFSPASIAGGVSGKTQFTPTISATGGGTLTAYCEADGVRSNDVRITFN